MRDDRFVKITLAAILLCLVVLIAQRVPARTELASGRYQLVFKANQPAGVHDTQTDQLYTIEGHRSTNPLLVPEELIASLRPVAGIAKELVPPVDTLDLLRETAMHSNSSNMRAWAADQLGLGPYEPAEVVEALIDALQDESNEVAVAASMSLSRKPDPAALTVLRAARTHSNPEVVANVERALSEIEP